MKRFWGLFVSSVVIVSLSACGQENRICENKSVVQEPSEIASTSRDESIMSEEAETGVLEDVFSQSENDVLEANSVSNSDKDESDSTQLETDAVELNENSQMKADPYVGEYNDYDVNEPALEIQKNDDETYTIQISILRLAYLDDGVGIVTNEGIEFTATAPNGKMLNGTITLKDDIATVVFLSKEWNEYSSVNVYKYYKISDIPNIYEYGSY